MSKACSNTFRIKHLHLCVFCMRIKKRDVNIRNDMYDDMKIQYTMPDVNKKSCYVIKSRDSIKFKTSSLN